MEILPVVILINTILRLPGTPEASCTTLQVLLPVLKRVAFPGTSPASIKFLYILHIQFGRNFHSSHCDQETAYFKDEKIPFTGTSTIVAPIDPGTTQVLPNGKIKIKNQVVDGLNIQKSVRWLPDNHFGTPTG